MNRNLGRFLAFAGIMLCALSLRSAVASLSPVFSYVGRDFDLPALVIGLIGTAPPLCFAIFGLLTPAIERKFGIEATTAMALGAIAAGLLLRGFVGESVSLLLTTALIFAGVGVGNILLPPLVKKYFPDRIGAMMTMYITALAVSTFVPPLVAVPLAESLNWRFAVASWAVFAAAGVLPWLLLMIRERAARGSALTAPGAIGEEVVSLATGPLEIATASTSVVRRLSREPIAWAITATFAASAIMAYTSFAWLPAILVDQAGVSPAAAGALLSLWAMVGLPASLIVPIAVVRWGGELWVFLIANAAGLAGLIGLLIVPSLAVVWVILFGAVAAQFPLALVLISIRAGTPESAVGLSSFVQSIGYMTAAAFPLVIGAVHDQTGGWTAPLIILIVVLVLTLPFARGISLKRTV